MKSGLIGIGWKNDKLYVKMHFDDIWVGDFFVKAHDEVFCYSGVSEADYDKLVERK